MTRGQRFDSGALSKTAPKIHVDAECPCCDEAVGMDLCELILVGSFGHADCGETKMQALVWTDVEVRDVDDIPELEVRD